MFSISWGVSIPGGKPHIEWEFCMFSMLQILFSNIEAILDVHKEVLSAVEGSLQPEPQPQHALGHVFLQFVSYTHTHLSPPSPLTSLHPVR